MVPSIKIDTREFQRTLRSYMQYSKKDVADIINAKAFFIARGAARNTRVAEKKAINNSLWHTWDFKRANGTTGEAPIIGVLAEKWAKKNLGRGLSPKSKSDLKTLRALVKQIEGARMRARAFMRSGWIPAIKGFGRKMDAAERFLAGSKALARLDTSFPKPKGGFSAAKPGIVAKAILWNASAAKRGKDPGGQLDKIAGTALKQAMADEVASMKAYVERKMNGTARRVNR